MKAASQALVLVATLFAFSIATSRAGDLTSLLREAQDGNLRAELHVSGYYFNRAGDDLLNGNPLQQRLDNNRSLYWLMKSARGGYPPAESTLGGDYLEGMGIQQSCARALYWLHRAATAGYVRARQFLNKPSMMGGCEG